MKKLNVLNKKELIHLLETLVERDIETAFRKNRTSQKEMKEKGGVEPCWDCRFIAKKLGIEE